MQGWQAATGRVSCRGDALKVLGSWLLKFGVCFWGVGRGLAASCKGKQAATGRVSCADCSSPALLLYTKI